MILHNQIFKLLNKTFSKRATIANFDYLSHFHGRTIKLD